MTVRVLFFGNPIDGGIYGVGHLCAGQTVRWRIRQQCAASGKGGDGHGGRIHVPIVPGHGKAAIRVLSVEQRTCCLFCGMDSRRYTVYEQMEPEHLAHDPKRADTRVRRLYNKRILHTTHAAGKHRQRDPFAGYGILWYGIRDKTVQCGGVGGEIQSPVSIVQSDR